MLINTRVCFSVQKIQLHFFAKFVLRSSTHIRVYIYYYIEFIVYVVLFTYIALFKVYCFVIAYPAYATREHETS